MLKAIQSMNEEQLADFLFELCCDALAEYNDGYDFDEEDAVRLAERILG